MGRLDMVRRIYASIWLTWLESSNWTHPLIYIVYIMIRPVFSILIYGFVYLAFASYAGVWNSESALYVVGGSALYQFIVSGMEGVSWVVHEEREHYQTLKYVYLSHPSLQRYLINRGLLGYTAGMFLMIVTLLLGSMIIGLYRFSINLPLVAVGILIGVVWSALLGTLASAISLFSSEYGTVVALSFSSFLIIFGDVIFPSEILPEWASLIAHTLPLKDWMVMMRLAIFGTGSVDVTASLTSQILKTIIIFLVSITVFKLADFLVRKKGYIDITTEH
ncbi:MAG: hypothetical protein ACUVQ0_05530 [Thermoproteota archaeon]